MGLEGGSPRGARIRSVEARVDGARMACAAGTDAGRDRVGARHVGTASRDGARAAPGERPAARARDGRGRGALRPHRAARRPRGGAPGLPRAMKITHGHLSLVLHDLRPGAGDPLLLLHELGGSSAAWGGFADAWPGAVLALDFAGHGGASSRAGGAYTPEVFAGDAGAAL